MLNLTPNANLPWTVVSEIPTLNGTTVILPSENTYYSMATLLEGTKQASRALKER